MRRGFFSRLLYSFMMVSIVPVILLGVFTMFISMKVSMTQLEKQVMSTSLRAGDALGQLFSDFGERLEVFSEDRELLEVLKGAYTSESTIQDINQKMYILLVGYASEFGMHVVSRDGKLSVSQRFQSPLYDSALFSQWGLLRAVANQEKYVVYPNRYVTSEGVEIAVSLGCAIRDPQTRELLGYALLDIPYQSIEKVLSGVATDLPVLYALLDKRQFLVYDNLGIGEGSPFVKESYRAKIAPLTEEKSYLQRFKGERFLLASGQVPSYGLQILSAVPVGLVFRNLTYIGIVTLVLAVLALILCLIFSWMVAKSISTPVLEIVRVMARVEQGDMQIRSNIKSHDEIGLLSRGLNRMIWKLDKLFRLDLEKQDRLRLAEIKHLQAQINPHFLYNTLDSIRYLSKLNMNKEINLVVSRLGILLKSSMSNNDDIETVDETMQIIASYLAIQQVIYPDKFDFSLDISEELRKVLLPKLIIQPIVENAIFHGMGTITRKCLLEVKGRVENNVCVLEIIDDGAGIEDSVLSLLLDSDRTDDSSKGIGVNNVHRRIQLYYGAEYGLEIKSQVGLGTVVSISVPLVYDPQWFRAKYREGEAPCIE